MGYEVDLHTDFSWDIIYWLIRASLGIFQNLAIPFGFRHSIISNTKYKSHIAVKMSCEPGLYDELF